MTTKAERTHWFYDRMAALGFSFEETEQLRRIQMTLHRWADDECGDSNDYCSWSIERDETTGRPYRCVYPHTGKMYRTAIPDREKGALARLRAILATHGELVAYHQTDPRGCALYIVRKSDIPEGRSLDSCYTNGVAVCI